MDAVVRRAVEGDESVVFGLLRRFAISYPPDESAFRAHYGGVVADPNATLLVAEQDAKVVGYLLGYRMVTFYANGPIVEILEVVVHHDYRGHGIGKALIEQVIQQSRKDGCIEVTVPTRHAGEFYEQFGFVDAAGYYKLKLGQSSWALHQPGD